MKWYWPVCGDNTRPDPYVGDSGDLGWVADDVLDIGKPIYNWSSAAWIQAQKPSNDGDPDDVLQTYLAPPIYSPRLRQALDEAGITGIQYLPLRVLRPDNSEIIGFSVANILHVADALDCGRSEYELFPADYFLPERIGQIRAIRKSTLIGSEIERFTIFRLLSFLPRIYVAQLFKDVFEAGQFTGYSFSEVAVSR